MRYSLILFLLIGVCIGALPQYNRDLLGHMSFEVEAPVYTDYSKIELSNTENIEIGMVLFNVKNATACMVTQVYDKKHVSLISVGKNIFSAKPGDVLIQTIRYRGIYEPFVVLEDEHNPKNFLRYTVL